MVCIAYSCIQSLAKCEQDESSDDDCLLWLPSLLQSPTSKHNHSTGTPNVEAAGRSARQGWQAEQKQTMIAV